LLTILFGLLMDWYALLVRWAARVSQGMIVPHTLNLTLYDQFSAL
jgi:hypothetical protein